MAVELDGVAAVFPTFEVEELMFATKVFWAILNRGRRDEGSINRSIACALSPVVGMAYKCKTGVPSPGCDSQKRVLLMRYRMKTRLLYEGN
jgi:hypothetical protein